MDYSEAIKRARKEKFLTQKELADASGLSVSAIKFFEQGRSEPNAGSIKKIAKALNVSIDYLVGRTDDPTPIVVEHISSERVAFIDEVMKMPDQDLERLIKYYELIKAASGGVADGSV